MIRPSPGCRMSVIPSNRLTFEARRELSRLRITCDAIIYATFIDNAGLSVYIKRGDRLPDIEAFIPNAAFANWASYFETGTAFGDGNNVGYVASRHSRKRFPDECV